MDMDLNGRRVFITGASSGIGLGTARVFAGAGASVALCARSADKLNALAEEINQGGGRAVACPADVTDTAALADALERAADALGGIDAVVHCAGTNIKGTADEVDEDGWDRIIDANLKSAYRLARLIHPMLRASAQADGRAAKFLVIGSVGTRLGIPQSGAYCASKGGLVQLVKVLSAEWARDNICVNAVCPGYIDTPLSARSLNMGDTRRRVLSRIPLGRLGQPEDIGRALAFLASDWSDYITGAALDVDGGYMACAYTMEG